MTTKEQIIVEVSAIGSTNAVEERRDQFVERILRSLGGAFDVFSMYIGYKLGYYDALRQYGPMTSVELSKRTSTQERYTREWLEQQTVVGVLEVEDAAQDAFHRRYSLPAGHDEVLTERDSLNFIAPIIQSLVAVTRPMDQLLDAYRNGGGVELSEYGQDFVEGQGGANRAAFLQELGQSWLPTMPDVHERLQSETPARVADIGVGVGWSSIGMALQYPNIEVDAFDLDEPSIMEARENARRYGVEDRVHFYVRDAADPQLAGQYDLVTAFETIHDMSNPVGALLTMRRLANGSGAVLVVDERVGESFTPTGNEIEWMMYGWSILHCLPVGMTEHNAAGTGTVMRPETLRRYANSAGYRDMQVLPIDNFFFRFYRLIP